jgi:dCMP deaminase
MFIGIAGPTSSGKHTIAQYLVEQHGFKFLTLDNFQDIFERETLYEKSTRFATLIEMQSYVTERWQENFVTCDVDCRGLWTLK